MGSLQGTSSSRRWKGCSLMDNSWAMHLLCHFHSCNRQVSACRKNLFSFLFLILKPKNVCSMERVSRRYRVQWTAQWNWSLIMPQWSSALLSDPSQKMWTICVMEHHSSFSYGLKAIKLQNYFTSFCFDNQHRHFTLSGIKYQEAFNKYYTSEPANKWQMPVAKV